jgi:hypothetical protein
LNNSLFQLARLSQLCRSNELAICSVRFAAVGFHWSRWLCHLRKLDVLLFERDGFLIAHYRLSDDLRTSFILHDAAGLFRRVFVAQDIYFL